MTLLELVIVVALLSIVALAGTSLIVDTGEWKQQQITEDQWLAAKRSILGDNVVDAHYRREYSGFVADMGRLPECMRELIRAKDCTPDLSSAADLNLFTQDVDSNQWYGWRGPYLGTPGANEYRDGWRNQGRTDDTLNDDDVNFGWLYGIATNGTSCQDADALQSVAGAIILQSCGDDGDVDNTETGFPGDFPYVENDAGDITYIPLVTRYDYQVNLGDSWIDAPVKFKSSTLASSRIIPADSLRLRINYPVNGQMPDWSEIPDRDTAPFLSATFPSAAARLVDATSKVYTGRDTGSDLLTDGAGENVVVPTGTTLSGTLMLVPNAASGTLLEFSDNSQILLKNCLCELEVDAGSITTSGSPVITTLTGATTIAIQPENIAPVTADLSKYVIEVPIDAELSGNTVNMPNGSTLTLGGIPDGTYFPKIILDPTDPSVTASSPVSSLDGDLVLIDDDQFLVAPASGLSGTNTIDVALAVPAIPQGLRNITIVCETDGLLYDGDCNAGETSIATPYQLELSPRAYVSVPDEIVWNIP